MDNLSTPNTHYGAQRIDTVIKNCKNKTVFFSGAGGVMMSSLALLTKKMGYLVKGSDRSRTEITEELENSGIEISYCHSRDNIDENCGALVYTVAISDDNPEYVRAGELGIPRISRADYLGYIMTGYKNRIGIAGMHGKSTTTSMCAQIFLDAAKARIAGEPTIISGAAYGPMGGAYYIGSNENFIFEACEYMDSFLDFNPTVAVLLNAEMEHVDYFKSLDQIVNSFSKYASLTGSEGYAVANADDRNIMRSVNGYCGKLITFGIKNECDFRAVDIETARGLPAFDMLYGNEKVFRVQLPVCGEHNIYNALASAAAAYVCGIDFECIRKGLESFSGTKRRMEYKGKIKGADVWDDYGHHPTEVGATLAGARQMCPGRLICVFQPHTYSRTAALRDKFKSAFEPCDIVLLCDIYAAREENIYGISSEGLASVVGEKAVYAKDIKSCAKTLESIVREGDTVVIMGAGDIYNIYKELDLEN